MTYVELLDPEMIDDVIWRSRAAGFSVRFSSEEMENLTREIDSSMSEGVVVLMRKVEELSTPPGLSTSRAAGTGVDVVDDGGRWTPVNRI